MISYEQLVGEIDIRFDDRAILPERIKGLYIETPSIEMILINRNIKNTKERKCILAEEYGHYKKTVGHIFDQTSTHNVKQECIARRWAYEKIIPLSFIIRARLEGITNAFELSEYLEVTEEFVNLSLTYYKDKYGVFARHEGCLINLDTLEIYT